MAYISQFEADRQQDAKEQQTYQNLGNSLIRGVQGMEENRRRAIDEKRAMEQIEIQRQEALRQGKLFDAKMQEQSYVEAQRALAPTERDDFKQKSALAKLSAETTEGTRLKAEERARKLQLEKDERSAIKTEEKNKFDAIDGIRKEISTLPATKGLVEIDTALSKINTAEETAPGDMSVIFNYMKVLDPGSTVREGEYATAEQARGVDSSILAAYNRVKDGERLTPEQRALFKSNAAKLAKSQYDTYNAYVTPHRNRVKQLGVDEAQVFPAFSQQEYFNASTAPKKQTPVTIRPEIMQTVQSMTPEQRAAEKQRLLSKIQGGR